MRNLWVVSPKRKWLRALLVFMSIGNFIGGFRDLGDETDADAGYAFAPVTGRVDLTDVDTTSAGFHQEALVPLGSETHAGEDVGVYAMGPGAHLVTGTNEQSFLFHVMDFAADLVTTADEKVTP